MFSARKLKFIVLAAVFIILAAGLSGAYILRWQAARSDVDAKDENATPDLGITYLAMNPSISAYYGLAVDSGALITAVSPGSPAAKGGIQTGDIILKFDDVTIKESGTLLTLIRSCSPGSRINLEVWRENAGCSVNVSLGIE